MSEATLTYADLFSGCGGLSYGFKKSKFFNGILATDFWNSAGKTYKYNHPNVVFQLRDLYDKAQVDNVCDILDCKCDVLLGGPPCQGFSTLGKRRENCKKSSLVDTFFEIALRTRPKIILMENVRGLISKKHPSGTSYPEHIKKLLKSNRYGVTYDYYDFLINALDYGLAQTRTRYIFIAIRSDLNHSFPLLKSILKGINNRKTKKEKNLRDVIGDLPLIHCGEGGQEIEAVINGKKKIIFNHQPMKHSKKLRERLSHVTKGGGLVDVPRELLTEHLIKMVEGRYGSGGHVKNIYGRLEWDKPCGTIVAGMDKITCGRYVHPDSDRLLTPRECARIQSYPDNFRFFGSHVTQYYLIGNSVPPKFSSVFASSIAAAIKSMALSSDSEMLKISNL